MIFHIFYIYNRYPPV